MTDEKTIYYGPHACEGCGATIVKAARESGGSAFDVPEHLLRVFQRGAESGNVEIAYPATWTPHVCCAASDRTGVEWSGDPVPAPFSTL